MHFTGVYNLFVYNSETLSYAGPREKEAPGFGRDFAYRYIRSENHFFRQSILSKKYGENGGIGKLKAKNETRGGYDYIRKD